MVGNCLRMTCDCQRLSYKHCKITNNLSTPAIVDNRWLSANGRRSILVNSMTSCCKSEELQENISNQKWLLTTTVWWQLLKPLVRHSQTNRQVIKDNLRLLPTKLIGNRFSVLHQHPAADNNCRKPLRRSLKIFNDQQKLVLQVVLRIRKTYSRSEVVAHLYWS